ncbi:cytochrome P450 [Phaeosphaeria sp. MPI-PUGE-AT-0046c]|nr:cytochrome P450 [Phaeosphaeria sp. MPI-PUGE-AT-0046c]
MTLLGLLVKAIGLGAIIVISQYVLAYLQSPLKNIPGPFLAKFSNIWRFLNHYGQTHIETQRTLHKKHGDVVRLGPNTVSFSDVSVIKTIYNTRGTFLKSDYYSINDALQDGHIIQNMFSTRSNEYHSKTIRPVQKLYNHQSALQLEDFMNDDLRTLCTQLESRFVTGANKGKTCDIADWIGYFAWDFLGHMTWSKQFGFMEEAKDIGGMLGTAERVMRYFSVVGQIPALDHWLGKNPRWPRSLYKFDDFSVAAGFSVERFMERMQEDPEVSKGKKDFLNGFLEAKRENPDLVTDNEVIGYMIINVLGGADTLAIVIKAIFYHILRTPRAHSLLTTELRNAHLAFPAPYTSISTLPYLDACIKEGLRMHPVVGHIFERVVPTSGLTLSDGTVLPPGTIVGVNPWVIHYKEDIFGAKTEEFRPERWLRGAGESEEVYEARMRGMKEADMAFGGGNRVCVGKPLALVEVYKVVATVFARFNIELEDPKKEWDLHKQWFVWPHDVKVKMSLA